MQISFFCGLVCLCQISAQNSKKNSQFKFSLLEGRYEFAYEVKKKMRRKKLPLREADIAHFINKFFEIKVKNCYLLISPVKAPIFQFLRIFRLGNRRQGAFCRLQAEAEIWHVAQKITNKVDDIILT